MQNKAGILIVDDNPDIREYLNEIIAELGYQPYPASTGMEALDILTENNQIDLILLDVIMPEMNGFDVLASIRKNKEYDEIRIIMLTALQYIEDKELAFKLGASDYLQKPFDIRELSARIKTHIGLKKVTENYISQKNLLDTIFSTIPGLVTLKGKNYEYIHANEKFYDCLNLSSEIITGKTDADIFPVDIADERKKSDDLIINLGIKELEYEEDFPLSEGKSVHLLTRKRPVYDSEGKCSGIVSVSLDITEQAVLKEAFFEKEILLSALIENIPFELWAIDNDYNFLLQNKTHFEKWGNVIGKNILSLDIPDDIKKAWKDSAECVFSGNNRIDQYPKEEADGLHWYIKELRPIKSDDKILGCFGIKQDITVKQMLQTHYERLNKVLPELMDLLSDPVIIFSNKTKLPIWKNKSAISLIYGKNCNDQSGTMEIDIKENLAKITYNNKKFVGNVAGILFWNEEEICIIIMSSNQQENNRTFN